MEGISTGFKGLDKLLTGLQLGDNVVWQIDDIEDYRYFVIPYVKKAVKDGRKVSYIRFSKYAPLVKSGKNIAVYELDASKGFESFSTELNKIIEANGEGAFYVFDCLSDLLSSWATDLMIGNFFRIMCPYLYILNTIAYFSIIRNRHSFKTVARIRETTQLLLDLYRLEERYYVHPLKVWNRYSTTMFLPHVKKGEHFIPLTNSVDVANLFSYIGEMGAEGAKRNLDYWDLLFLQAEELLEKKGNHGERKAMFERLSHITIGREARVLDLLGKHMGLEDLLHVKARMIGSGFIGGKAVGMLLARKILMNDKDYDWDSKLEQHDSYYICSDVFYTYIVQNGWWKLRMEQKTPEGYFRVAEELQGLLLKGEFPDEIKEQFRQMMEYFGQSPIIVRSSSLLEDSFGNAFAGKYESVFCANQGAPEDRLNQFIQAVRRIYASTMNPDALTYRLQRGLAEQDEQMALLVQRVSGSYHKKYFFPDIGGVGISYNTYVWKEGLDPKAGMLRIVFGLGTRAVNRVEGDYPRIVALDAPLLKAHAGMKDSTRFSQHQVDLIDVKENRLKTVLFDDLLKEKLEIPLAHIASVNDGSAHWGEGQARAASGQAILTFDPVLSDEKFVECLQRLLGSLEKAYEYPVDTEFTVNFASGGEFQINLLQCRPLQTRGIGKKVEIPKTIAKDKILFESKASFLGGNISHPIHQVIFVNPEKYSALSQSEKYDIARAVGTLNRQIDKESQPTLLIGPGRWGTTTPSFGVPVSFSEINNVMVMVELSFVSGNCVPELSFGTHFFHDIVESDIFYAALFPEMKGVVFNRKLLDSLPNALENRAIHYAKYKDVVKIADVKSKKWRLMADIVSQRVVLFSSAK